MKVLNNNIQESFCSFEVSKLLNGKGFENNYCQCYTEDKEFYSTPNLLNESLTGKKKPITVPAPTHSLAIEWLRVNFGIWINVYQAFQFNEGREDYLKSKGFAPNITITKNEVYQALPDTVVDKYYIEPYHNTPQEATEFALKYVLEELI